MAENKPRYSRVSDILDLAIFMSSKIQGVTINEIAQRYNVSRRTAERMRDSLTCIFPSVDEIETKDISFAIFTLTSDLNADFPAKYARLNCGFNQVPMMCYEELDVPNSLKMCLRILLNVNTNKTQDEIKHVYLKGASILRGDLKNE